MRFDLDTLKLFVLVVEHGSISAASEPGNIVTSAISRRLSDLEEEAGVPLLRRRSRGVEPTAAGLSIYQHAKSILGQLRQIDCDISEHRSGIKGNVRIWVNMTALCYYLPAQLHTFMAEYPDVSIELVEKLSDAIPHAVKAGEADLGICAPTDSVAGVSEAIYVTDPLVLIVPRDHKFASRKRIRFEDTLDEKHIMMQSGASIHTMSQMAARALKRKIPLSVLVTSFDAVRNMVSEGMGIAIIPELALKGVDATRYNVVRLTDKWCWRKFKILWNDQLPQSPATMRLLKHLRNDIL
ncbi:LysR family transcriptional regulator [Herbaspirillum lusitanum]|uniref:LysR family transcriptional regulator n=1 Tax=Herbaspirillum lusitanum TaxID=213312 RepID=UPI0022378DA0|nr:LysR family transcriptional regulator [Herbaspirillum lusitanum]MCW5297729.1 LysR family transcriptional regulator [Herbaspirillum lusitanum]